MVAHNPLFHGRWTAKKFGATVLDDIWPEVLFFTLISTMVTLVSKLTSVNLGVSNQLLTVLGLVLGLVISFRTSSAYERYQDGRKMWTNITVGSKNLAQLIWVHVPITRTAPSGSTDKVATILEATLEKKTMINVIQAFSVSVKHLLRGEQGVYYEDLYPLISFLPKYATEADANIENEANKLPLWHLRDEHQHLVDSSANAASVVIPEAEPMTHGAHKRTKAERTLVEEKVSRVSRSTSSSSTNLNEHHGGEIGNASQAGFVRVARADTFDPEVVLPLVESPYPLLPARNPPESTIFDYFPILRIFQWAWRIMSRHKSSETESNRHRDRKAFASIVESHVPLEICLFLSSYSAWLMKKGLLQPSIAVAMTNALVNFQDTVSNLQRICNTPLPFAYQAHLRISLWIYLLLLPFQIYTFFGYITIPATTFASFLLLGFLEIGQEIENPFNYDLNDLDLDHFCLSIQRDLHLITTHTNPDPQEFIFSRWNQPLAPSDRRNAVDIMTQTKDGAYTSPDGSGEPGIGTLRKTLVSGWKEVDTMTRAA